jgi:hypothetical protein
VEVLSPLPLGFSCKCIKSLRREFDWPAGVLKWL